MLRSRWAPVVFALVAPFTLAAGACSAQAPGGEPEEQVGVAAQAVTAQEAIMRAEEWVAAKLLYCQSPNGADDSIDPACSPICMRESNPQWDPYRSDCSGLVSWAWGLPAPGRTTAEFSPNQNDITSIIQASDLQMGDAVCTDDSASSEHHIMLFKEWTVQGQTATFIEEPGCSANPNYAHEFTSDVVLNGTSITVNYNGIAFVAIRYGALGSTSSSSASSTSTSGSTAPPCQVNGVDGTCIDTSVCATMPGYVSTPGFCPGPASEQCCTPTGNAAATSTGSGSTTGAGGAGSGGAGGASGSTGTTAGGTGAGGAVGHATSSSGAGGQRGNARGNDVTSGCSAAPAGGGGACAWLVGLAVAAFAARRRAGC